MIYALRNSESGQEHRNANNHYNNPFKEYKALSEHIKKKKKLLILHEEDTNTTLKAGCMGGQPSVNSKQGKKLLPKDTDEKVE